MAQKTKRKRIKAILPKARQIELAIRQAQSQKDLDRCEEMLGNLIYGRAYLLGQIVIMRGMVEIITTTESCYRDNPKMVITQCLIEPIKKFRMAVNYEPYDAEQP